MPGKSRLTALTKKKDFKLLTRKGVLWNEPTFRVYFLARKSESYPRFAISASRKVGSAVVRNLAKRRIRSIMKERILYNKNNPLGDWLIVANPKISAVSYKDIEANLINSTKAIKHKSRKKFIKAC